MESATARQALDTGGMLVFEQNRVVDGTGSVEVSTVDSTTGAPARTRLVPVPAAVVAGLGALLGTVGGFVPTVAYLYADTRMRFVAPWQNLLVIADVVPAVAALAAGLLTRSRLPLAHRLG